jgi:hypothetical protein
MDFSAYWQRHVARRRLANEIDAKSYEIFIIRNEYNIALWTHS